MIRCLMILLVLLMVPLRANLGDTVADCVKRYGKPVGYSEATAKSPFGTLVFQAGSYQLVVFLLDSAEVGARVSKADNTAFNEAELKTVMDADATSAWNTTDSPDPACLRWIRTDKATAMYDKDNHVVIFSSKAMADALHAPRKPVAAQGPTRPPGDFAPAAPANWSALTNAPAHVAPEAKP